MARSPFPFSFDLSCGGYKVSGTIPERRLDVYRYDCWCGSITLDHGEVAAISINAPKGAEKFPRDEAVKALRRILGTRDDASQLEEA